jgi:hypothetical protein
MGCGSVKPPMWLGAAKAETIAGRVHAAVVVGVGVGVVAVDADVAAVAVVATACRYRGTSFALVVQWEC